jgi:type I restriction enzyme S subunit
VRVSNISESGEIDLNKNIVFLDDAEATTYSNFLIREGDVLLVMVGATVGKLGFVKATNLPALLNQNMWALRTKNHEYINQKYCQYALVVLVGKYKQAQQGSARAFFTQSDFGNQLIAIPPMPEQLMISKVLSSVDLKIELLHKKYKGYSTLKRGLMQKLLTGEWRVKLDSPTCTA